jgi:hypothetical protein
MRLSEPKIAYLASKIAEVLLKEPQVKLLAPANAIDPAVKEAILFDLKREDALEQEAVQLLAQHRDELEHEDIDYRAMLTKTKLLLAKQKGIVL